MLGTIDLYKLALTPNDTLYFDSVNDQTDWFDNQEHLSIDNISFNGARAFQIDGNYLDLIFNYNYVRYKLNDRYIYAFIENIDYANDNCATLNISIDLNQTFLAELQTAISTSNIGNVTKKDSYFSTYKPYENKYPVDEYESYHLGKLNPNAGISVSGHEILCGYILLNIDPMLEVYVPIADGSTKKIGWVLTDNNYVTPCSCLAFPIQYDLTDRIFRSVTYMNCKINNTDTDIIGSNLLTTFMLTYGSYMVDKCIGITFEKIANIELAGNQENGYYLNLDSNNCVIVNDVLSEPHEQGHYPVEIGNLLVIKKNNTKNIVTFNLNTYLSNIPLPLIRSPYVYIRIGNDSEYITLNVLDFLNSIAINKPLTLKVEYFTSCIYPFVTNIVFFINDRPITDRNAIFNLITSEPVPYKISAWENFYANNKASVNDGLATAQKYGRKESLLRLGGDLIGGAIDTATILTPFTKKGKLSSRRLSDKEVYSAGTGAISTIINAGINYANSELERQKEKALLNISWNDIKSQPNEFSNVSSNLTSKYNKGPQCIEVDIYIAKNINDIINYHKQYGYKVNRMETLTWADIKQHTVFDYIAFNTITLKSTLPQFYTAMIEQQYEQGVRFWYDYTNFMNYQIENTERGN